VSKKRLGEEENEGYRVSAGHAVEVFVEATYVF
jgi:hypothetical protein